MLHEKTFPFASPQPKSPITTFQRVATEKHSQNCLNHLYCPLLLHPASPPDLSTLYALLIKYLITVVAWFRKCLVYLSYVYISHFIYCIELKTLKSHVSGSNVSQIPLHFWNIWMVSKGILRTLNVRTASEVSCVLGSSYRDSLEQTLSTKMIRLSNAGSIRKIINTLFINKIKSSDHERSNCKNWSVTTLLS